MKILRIYLKIPPLPGGMEKHIRFLTTCQRDMGYEVTLCFNGGEPIDKDDMKVASRFRFYTIKPQVVGTILFYLFVVVKMFSLKKQYDVIHIHGDWSSLILSRILQKITKSKLIVFSVHDQLSQKLTHAIFLPYFLKRVNLVFSTGFSAAQQIKKSRSLPIFVQPSGIDDAYFDRKERNFSENGKVIITVANLFRKKNIECVLEIAEALTEYEFLIVGEGPQRFFLEKIKENRRIGNVKFLGYKTQREIKDLYDKSDCYLLTSFAEGTPTSLIEAMASGLPIVSSNAGGVEHIIQDKVNGFVVHNFDKNNYINYLSIILTDKLLREAMSENNTILAKNYTWRSVSKNITDLTKDLLYETD